MTGLFVVGINGSGASRRTFFLVRMHELLIPRATPAASSTCASPHGCADGDRKRLSLPAR